MKHGMNAHLWAKAFLAATILVGSGHAATIYVCKTSDPDCTWDTGHSSDHFEELQDALADATTGTPTEIWVAKGVYYPDDGTGVTADDRTATFPLKDKVDIYGGFKGDESTLGARVFGCGGDETLLCSTNDDCEPGTTCKNATILNGDIHQNDGTSCTDDDCSGLTGSCFSGFCTGDNSYHIVTYGTANAVVTFDGFTVQAGQADGTTNNRNQGGAVHIRDDTNLCISGGPTLTNCIFRDNYALDHAAVNDHGHTTTITNCVFVDNLSDHLGGALVIQHGNTVVTDCLFENNKTAVPGHQEGGAVWLSVVTGNSSCAGDHGKPTFTNCVFTGNKNQDATHAGGGAIWTDATEVTIDGCSFSGNESLNPSSLVLYAGAIYIVGGETNIVDSQFTDNKAERYGGAVSVTDADATFVNTTFTGNETFDTVGVGGAVSVHGSVTTVAFTNCTIADNHVNGKGGGIYVGNATVTAVNCTITNNHAGDDGGGILVSSNATVSVINCTIANNNADADNNADGDGGGIWIKSTGTLTTVNSILWANTDKDGQDETAQVFNDGGTLTVTYSDWEGHSTGTGNINADPEFVTEYTDLRLQSTSPCLDAGENDALAGITCTTDSDCRPTEECIDFGGTKKCRIIIDLDDKCRIINDDVDMGAYERGTEPSCCLAEVECCQPSDCSFPTRKCCDNECKACCTGGDCPFFKPNCCNGVCQPEGC